MAASQADRVALPETTRTGRRVALPSRSAPLNPSRAAIWSLSYALSHRLKVALFNPVLAATSSPYAPSLRHLRSMVPLQSRPQAGLNAGP